MNLLAVWTLQLTSLLYKYTNVIDVSHHNGKIDWATVKSSGLNFAFIKSSQGANYIDPMFVSNWNSASNNQFNLGAYHFYEPKVSYKKQFMNFRSCLLKVNISLPSNAIALDVEKIGNISKAQYSDDIYSFLELLKSNFEVPIFLYTGNSFWNGNIDWRRHDFTQYLLWVASYTKNPQPTMPGNWTTWGLWQYTDKGKVNGIKGYVDLDYLPFGIPQN